MSTVPAKPIPAPRVKETLQRIKQNIARVIRGKDGVIDQVLITLVAGGHLLLEDLPGLGKTTMAYCLARSLDCQFSRIQFNSDLLPSDILGVSIYDDNLKEFIFKKGPLFANIVLADEINRTTPKTQSSLLEVMDRGKVSIDGQSYPVGQPFMVFATQNPVDYEGTFPLPESQMDRFFMRLQMGYPALADEMLILQAATTRRNYDMIDLEPVATRADIAELQHYTPQIYIEDSVLEYILKIVAATRTEAEFQAGISTRGSLALKLAAQAAALADGRSFVVPADVQQVLKAVCVHRLALRSAAADALEERRLAEGLLARIVDRIPAPV
jgi:MoxR-like ATPase